MLALALLLAVPAARDHAQERGVPVAQVNAQAAGTGYRRRHALVVGIDAYEDPTFPDLGYAVADARAVARVLIERYGFDPGDVRLLLNEDATKRALDTALEEWACDSRRVSREDQLVVFFAGHGITRTSALGDHGYLVPVDGDVDARDQPAWSTLVGMRDLETVSELIPAKHVLFILDACFSGLAVGRSVAPVAAGLTSRARQVITAGTAAQTVLDTGGGGHSVFTGALLDALSGNADLDIDQVITFGELFNYIGREVERKTERRQTPLQAAFRDHGGGSVALFPPGVRPGRSTAAERLAALEGTLERRLAELERLSDFILVGDQVREADSLWPAQPEMIPRYRSWLMRSRELLERKQQHRGSVRQVRQEAFLGQVLAGRVEDGTGIEPTWAEVPPELRWRHETFVELVARLEELEAGLMAEDALAGRHGWSIPRRLAFAERLRAGFAPGGEYALRWRRNLPDLRAAYPGLVLEPQMGLVPLGPDPRSKLWEFWHVQSGREPRRAADGGVLPDAASGLVFVLLPPGEFWMGASSEAGARNYDGEANADESPVHAVELAPFFMSKYELTQAQWERASGEKPSYRSGTTGDEAQGGLHPVEQVSWLDCDRELRRLGLELPSEAQWEYACRAGSTTPRPFAEEEFPLHANIRDAAYQALFPEKAECAPWDDGFPAHAPVGSLRPNGFGLHDMIGNVWEWCRDEYDREFYSRSAPREPTNLDRASDGRVTRGGGYQNAAIRARSTDRARSSASSTGYSLGVRPTRALTD